MDISADAARHVVIARGTEKEYQGHCDTVLMADGRTMFTAWCMNHAGHLGPLARSGYGASLPVTRGVADFTPGYHP